MSQEEVKEEIKSGTTDIEVNTEVSEDTETPERMEFRRMRVKRIKMILVLLLIVFLIIPNIICGFLLYELYKMNKSMESLRQEIIVSKQEIEKKAKEDAARAEQLAAMQKVELTPEEQLTRLNLTDEEAYPGKQLVYLTFDDGPSKYTDEILDILAKYDAKATFFVLAKEGYDEQYNRILDEGHTLAMHSYTHRYSQIYSSMDAYKEDVTSLSDFLVEKTGVRPTFYRFPGGSSNSVAKVGIQDMLHFLSEEGYVHFDWNVSSEDATPVMLEASTISRNVINGIGSKKESVVLMHDSAAKRSTVEALPVIIESLQRKGNVVFLPITNSTKQVYHVREKTGEEENTNTVSEPESVEKKLVESVSEEVSEAVKEELAEDASEDLEQTEVVSEEAEETESAKTEAAEETDKALEATVESAPEQTEE